MSLENNLILNFPDNFLFGSATAPYQVEGNFDSQRVTDWDVFLQKNPHKEFFKGHAGPNWWMPETAEQDFALLQRLGLNAQRLGFEWARIMPEERKVSLASLKRYRSKIDCLNNLGLLPVVTLSHFTLPDWVAKSGGWENRKNLGHFLDYVEVVLDNFGDVKYWLTMNEPMQLVGMGYLAGKWPPAKKNDVIGSLRVLNNISITNNKTYELIKKSIPDSNIGVAHSITFLKPETKDPISAGYAGIANKLFNELVINQTIKYADFIGMNFYHGYLLRFKPANIKIEMRDDIAGVAKMIPFGEIVLPDAPVNDAGWPIVPDFFYEALMYIHDKFRKKIIITESGIADRKDTQRSFYLLSHLFAISRALEKGIDIGGYFHWSSVHLPEWMYGYKYNFGLIDIDPISGQRSIKNSAKMYGRIAQEKRSNVPEFAEMYLQDYQKDALKKFISNISK